MYMYICMYVYMYMYMYMRMCMCMRIWVCIDRLCIFCVDKQVASAMIHERPAFAGEFRLTSSAWPSHKVTSMHLEHFVATPSFVLFRFTCSHHALIIFHAEVTDPSDPLHGLCEPA